MAPRHRIALRADADIREILSVSEASFGFAARLRYAALIEAAIERVAANPTWATTQDQSEILEGLRSFHLRHARTASDRARVGRPVHLLYYRVASDGIVEVVRVLHDRSDPALHLR